VLQQHRAPVVQAMRGLREQMVQAGQEHANGENAELAGILNSICPALKSSPNIAEKVRWCTSPGRHTAHCGLINAAHRTALHCRPSG
jgi:hypothetical protein